jgi:uncharacterized protein (DUF885 family)
MRREGAAFNLKAFHDAFLKEGPAALPVLRVAMLHELEKSPARRGP